ncbi:hypothetical protein L1887_21450 [Cichorium endivia]|nr:hypothetical protein L1887_21450 [Cichorium endivia]
MLQPTTAPYLKPPFFTILISLSLNLQRTQSTHKNLNKNGESSLLRKDGFEERPLDSSRRSNPHRLYKPSWPPKLARSSQTSRFIEVREKLQA